MESFELLVKGGTVMAPSGGVAADLGVRAGKVAAVGDLGRASGATVIDAEGLHLLPGVIDTQVHFREPGMEYKEDLASGTLGAVLGGVTAVFEMPNTRPPTTTPERLADKLARAKGRAHCDYAFYVGACPENLDHLGEMERLPGCCGVKVFMGSSTGDLLLADDQLLRRAMANGRRRMAFHAEDEDRLKARRPLVEAPGAHVAMHPDWRDVETAVLATRRLLAMARATGRKVHVLHVSTAEEMELLRGARDIATVEVTPQHLTLEAPECYERLGAFAQMNPPIRDARHRDGLWRALRDGVVDVIGSDHAPHSIAEKAKPYPQSPSGMPGVQTLLPLLLDHHHAGRLSLQRLVELTSVNAARIFGIKAKGALAEGFDADIAIVDLKRRQVIEQKWIASKCGWSPFVGMAVTGWPVMTVLRGQIIMRDGEVTGAARGRALDFAH
jgi:dihydroorotase